MFCRKVKFVQDTIENDSVIFKSVTYAENIDSLLKEAESVDDGNVASEQSKETADGVSCQGASSSSCTGTEDLEPSVNKKQGEKSIDCDDADGDELDELPDLFVRAKNLLLKDTENDSHHLSDIPFDSENVSFDHSQTLVDKVIEEEKVECNNSNRDDGSDDGNKNNPVNKEQIPSSSKPMDSSTDNNSGWVIDSNGMMQTDDPFMDELLCSDLNSQVQTAYTPSLEIHAQTPLSAELVATPPTTTTAEAEETTKSHATEPLLDLEIIASRKGASQKSLRKCLPLELLGPDVCSFTPKLSGSLTQAINLDDDNDDDEVEQPRGTDLLMQKLLKNTNVNKGRKQNTEVNIR